MQPIEQYFKYADALRNWLIVYGAGGIALLYSGEGLTDRTKIGRMTIAFLIAVFSQVMVTFVNKWHNWVTYMGEANPRIGASKWWNTLNSHLYVYLWVNAAVDIISLAAFLYATYLLATAFTIQIPSA